MGVVHTITEEGRRFLENTLPPFLYAGPGRDLKTSRFGALSGGDRSNVGFSPLNCFEGDSEGSWSPESSHANLRPYLRNKLNTRPPRHWLYLAHQAHHQALTRGLASHRPYRMEYDGLVDHVLSRFRSGWTPEEIAGRLAIDFSDNPSLRVSPETPYSWVYSPRMRSRVLWQYLPRGDKKRRIRGGRRVHHRRIRRRVGIDQRPTEVTSRDQFGHRESDSVIDQNHSYGLHPAVERTSRFLQARKLHQVTAGKTLTAQKKLCPVACSRCVVSHG